MESLDALISVAIQSISSNPEDRPTMHRVVQILESEIMTPCLSDFCSIVWKQCKDGRGHKICNLSFRFNLFILSAGLSTVTFPRFSLPNSISSNSSQLIKTWVPFSCYWSPHFPRFCAGFCFAKRIKSIPTSFSTKVNVICSSFILKSPIGKSPYLCLYNMTPSH